MTFRSFKYIITHFLSDGICNCNEALIENFSPLTRDYSTLPPAPCPTKILTQPRFFPQCIYSNNLNSMHTIVPNTRHCSPDDWVVISQIPASWDKTLNQSVQDCYMLGWWYEVCWLFSLASCVVRGIVGIIVGRQLRTQSSWCPKDRLTWPIVRYACTAGSTTLVIVA